MKKATMILAACCLFLTACGTQATTADKTANSHAATVVAASVAVPEWVIPEYCKHEGDGNKEYLKYIDVDLDALEKGQETCGSFSDWFAVNLSDAAESGVAKPELKRRIDRLVKLAEEGKFLSSFEERLFNQKEDGGAAGVRRYAEDAAGIINKK